MRLTRSRYVTMCQQFLVTAVVLAVGLTAAGVMTLQIVAPEGSSPRATALAPAIEVSDAFVDTRPVTPHVREVKVGGVDAAAAREIPGVVTAAPTAPSGGQTRKLAALSAPTKVHGYATVGVTWKSGTDLSEDQISVQVRTRTGDTWSGWTTAAYHDEHGPDPESVEARKIRPGTDAVVVGDVDEVQMKAETTSGKAPADLELAVVDPGAGAMAKQAPAIDTATLPSSTAPAGGADAGQGSAQSSDGADAALMAMKVSPKPTIYSRAQWGANEALRDPSSLRYGTIKTGFIHHTVNANNYTRDQVPALIRGIYAYHTQSRGWSDIGYNFLVDRFGRIWEGRFGGVDRPVVGAHTLGYNEYSFAMSAIGNFDIASPPQAVLDAYARLFAWKLSLSNIRADATKLWVKDRYLHAINGHRDVGQTACPGRYLYAKIPSVRVAAQAIENQAQGPVDPANLPPLAAPSGLPSPTQAPGPAPQQPAIRFPARVGSLIGSPWPDIVGKTSTGSVVIASTEGMVGFGPRRVVAGHWARMSAIAAVGDVTGDGKGDLLARNRSTGVTKVFRGDGTGGVAGEGIAPTTAFKGYDLILGAGDFDRDGYPDVIARQRTTTALMLFRGAGKGTFRSPRALKKRWPYQLTTVVGAFDRGGTPDVVAMARGGALYFLPGGGKKASLGASVRMGTMPSDTNGLYGVGDLTGDRMRDLAVRRAGGLTRIYSGTRSTRLGRAYGPVPSLSGLALSTSGDLLSRHGVEVTGLDAAGHLVVVAGSSRRNLGTVMTTKLLVPGASQVLDVGDWDRNGTVDLITRESARNQLVLRPGLGGGRFARGRSLGVGWQDVKKLTAVGDVTGDGYPDLVGRTGATDPWTIYPGAGNGGFRARVLAPSPLHTYNQVGNGSWSPTNAYLPSADGSLVPLADMRRTDALRTANGSTVTSYDSYVGVGDLNGDLIADTLAREQGTGTLWLLPGKASGGFGPRMWVAAGFGGYQLLG